jgi:hypothetical protein
MSTSDKPTSRLQKYRISDKGLAWLADATKKIICRSSCGRHRLMVYCVRVAYMAVMP